MSHPVRHQGGMHLIFYDGHVRWLHQHTLQGQPLLFVTSGAVGR